MAQNSASENNNGMFSDQQQQYIEPSVITQSNPPQSNDQITSSSSSGKDSQSILDAVLRSGTLESTKPDPASHSRNQMISNDAFPVPPCLSPTEPTSKKRQRSKSMGIPHNTTKSAKVSAKNKLVWNPTVLAAPVSVPAPKSPSPQSSCCFQHLPPINRSTLAELSIKKILHNPKLRHEIVFETKLEFRPKTMAEIDPVKLENAQYYWSRIEKDLANYDLFKNRFNCANNPSASRISRLVVEIKGMLLDILDDLEHPHLSRSISDIDDQLVLQQLRTGSFNPSAFTDPLIEIMLIIAKKERHPRIQSLSGLVDAGNYTAAFKDVLYCLEQIKMDIANSSIENFRTFLKSTSVSFEKNQFANYLNSKPEFPIFNSWWSSCLDKYKPKHTAMFSIFLAGFHDLLLDPSLKIPELFYMDEARISAFRSEISIIVQNSLLLFGFDQYAKNNPAQLLDRARFVSQLLLRPPTLSLDFLDTEDDKFIDFITSFVANSRPASNITSRRLTSISCDLISGAIDDPIPEFKRFCLDVFAVPIHSFFKRISMVSCHHWSVYGDYYVSFN
ncbi:Protein SOK1 [Smittium mucronatum]|uniref:Protein SOK1 n=1 Tax=Smittium mucronatum TaxID=133383 RepID=A0A1R0GU56_9FUNG|nr:Protein SOK1 [Smittium mucronatum]